MTSHQERYVTAYNRLQAVMKERDRLKDEQLNLEAELKTIRLEVESEFFRDMQAHLSVSWLLGSRE